MESFAVDIDPGQVVRWIMAEHRIASSTLKTVARRVTEVREIPARSTDHLGDEEREDLSEVATPGRGITNIVAEVDNPSAKLHVTRLLETIERNQHAGERKPRAS